MFNSMHRFITRCNIKKGNSETVKNTLHHTHKIDSFFLFLDIKNVHIKMGYLILTDGNVSFPFLLTN